MIINFLKKLTIDEIEFLKQENLRILTKHPNHIPIITIIDSNILKLPKKKFLVSKNLSFNDFIISVKHKLNTEESIKFFIKDNNNEINISPNYQYKKIENIYEQFVDKSTGFLFIIIRRETFYKLIKKFLNFY